MVEQDLVLGDIARRREAVEDDPGFTAVDQIVVLVPEHGAPVPHGHGGRVRIGAADLAGGEAAIGPSGQAVRVQATRLEQIPPSRAVSRRRIGLVWDGVALKEGDHLVAHDFPQPGHERIQGSVARDAGRVGQDLLAPDEARLLAKVDDVLEEAAEDVETEALADAGEAGGVGQRLIQAVAQIPADAEAIRGQGEELALGTDALEEHHQIELKEHHRVDGRPAPVGVGVPDPLPDEGEVEAGLQVAIEVVVGNEGVHGNGNGSGKVAGLDRAKHEHSPQPHPEVGRQSLPAITRRPPAGL